MCTLLWANQVHIPPPFGESPGRPFEFGADFVAHVFQKLVPKSQKGTKAAASPVPTAYKKLLEKYPGVLKCKFLEKPLHNIIHDIDTADNEPCRAKVRALMPGTVKEVKGHQKWLELEKQGVIVKIKPDEPVTWSSALHLVPKDGDDIRVTSDFRPLNNRTI